LADALRGPAEANLAEAGFVGSLCIDPSCRDVYTAEQNRVPHSGTSGTSAC